MGGVTSSWTREAHGGKAWDHSLLVRALEERANVEIGQPPA